MGGTEETFTKEVEAKERIGLFQAERGERMSLPDWWGKEECAARAQNEENERVVG